LDCLRFDNSSGTLLNLLNLILASPLPNELSLAIQDLRWMKNLRECIVPKLDLHTIYENIPASSKLHISKAAAVAINVFTNFKAKN
jgi:hypothetical protein